MVVQLFWQPCTLYVARDVEVYFKIIKKNTNIDFIKSHKTDKINKQISSTVTSSIIYNIILNIYKKHTKTNKLINNSQFINTFYDYFLYEPSNDKITFKSCMFFIDTFMFERVFFFLFYSFKRRTKLR